jgi:hypothetical protein
MVTSLVPDADLPTQNWLGQPTVVPGRPYFGHIDDTVDAANDDTNYLYTGSYLTATQAIFTLINLPSILSPSTTELHSIRVRYKKSGAGNGPQNFRVRLEDVGTNAVIKNAIFTEPATDDYVTYEIPLTPAEVDSIPSYNNLRVRLIAPTVGTGLATEFRVTAVEFTLPEPGEFPIGAFGGESEMGITLSGRAFLPVEFLGSSAFAVALGGRGSLVLSFLGQTEFLSPLLGRGRLGSLAVTGETTLAMALLGRGSMALAATGSTTLAVSLLGRGALSAAFQGSTALTAILAGRGFLLISYTGETIFSVSLSGNGVVPEEKGWIEALTSKLRVLVDSALTIPIKFPNGPRIAQSATFASVSVAIVRSKIVSSSSARIVGLLQVTISTLAGRGDKTVWDQIELLRENLTGHKEETLRLGSLNIGARLRLGSRYSVTVGFPFESKNGYVF